MKTYDIIIHMNKQEHMLLADTKIFNPETVYILKSRYTSALAKAALDPNFLNTTLTNRLHSAKQGEMLLLPDQLQSLRACDGVIEATFEPVEALNITREQSIHSVQFGRLTLEVGSEIPTQEYVAIKPESSVEKAVREAAAFGLVNTEKVVGKAYEPLGFIKQPDGDMALITRYAGQTESFDNVLWRNALEVSDEQIEDALSKAAISLSYLHLAGITHGDAQPKNIAWDSQTDSPWHIDLEESSLHMKERYKVCFEKEAINDLQTFMLFQPYMRSLDMFELVAEKYINNYNSHSNDKSPIKKDMIMGFSKNDLRPLPIV